MAHTFTLFLPYPSTIKVLHQKRFGFHRRIRHACPLTWQTRRISENSVLLPRGLSSAWTYLTSSTIRAKRVNAQLPTSILYRYGTNIHRQRVWRRRAHRYEIDFFFQLQAKTTTYESRSSRVNATTKLHIKLTAYAYRYWLLKHEKGVNHWQYIEGLLHNQDLRKGKKITTLPIACSQLDTQTFELLAWKM